MSKPVTHLLGCIIYSSDQSKSKTLSHVICPWLSQFRAISISDIPTQFFFNCLECPDFVCPEGTVSSVLVKPQSNAVNHYLLLNWWCRFFIEIFKVIFGLTDDLFPQKRMLDEHHLFHFHHNPRDLLLLLAVRHKLNYSKTVDGREIQMLRTYPCIYACVISCFTDLPLQVSVFVRVTDFF